MAAREADPMLRRLERNAVIACLAMAAVALAVRGGRPDVALGVLGGGLLVGASYLAIKASVDRLTARIVSRPSDATGGRPGRSGWAFGMALFVLRYALLGLIAYVMIARLRLHPVGLIVGATSVVAAAAVEAIRFIRT
jgi:hypothetical protein